MTRNAQDIIDDMRNIVKPRIAEMLFEANFEGCGKEDKAEFETEFEIILTLAEKALEQQPCEDTISRQAVIDAMCALCNTGETLEENPWRDNPHIDAIIDELDKLPSVTPQPCEDAISRQAAIDALEKVAELFPWRVPGKRDTYDSYNGAWNDAIGRAEMEIEGLPPVAPQPKTGHWIERESGTEDKENGFETVIVCSGCDFPATTFYSEDCERRTQIRTSFCPNCGAKMEVEE